MYFLCVCLHILVYYEYMWPHNREKKKKEVELIAIWKFPKFEQKNKIVYFSK